MPIIFEVNLDKDYFISKWTGVIYDEDMLNAYQKFLCSEKWVPGLKELGDFSEADLTNVTAVGFRVLADYIQKVCLEDYNSPTECFAYAPKASQKDLIRLYSSISSDKEVTNIVDSFEEGIEKVERVDSQ